MAITTQRFLARSKTTIRLLDEAKEAWRIEHDDAMAASDIEEMGHEFADTFDLLEKAWPQLRRSFFAGSSDLVLGRKLVTAIDSTINSSERLFQDADRVIVGGHVIDGLSELKEAIASARRIRAEASGYWPAAEVRSALRTAARVEFERGEFSELSELSGDAQAGRASDN